jgi:predicted GNAT family acetyltransferase
MQRARHLDKLFFYLKKKIMHIQHKEDEKRGMFFIPGEGADYLAELVYNHKEEETMVIEHTGVDEKLRGQNIGCQLVQAAVEHARTNNMKIVPLCTFAKAIIDKKAEFGDVLKG